MTTTFTIEKDNKCKEYKLEQDKTIMDLKELIIKDFSLNTEYIDINFILERPIRSLGKFNLEAGELPRTLDMYPLNRFELEGRIINATYNVVDNYTPIKRSIKPLNISKYKSKDNNVEPADQDEDTPFNINSLDDFPSLS